MWGTRSGSRVGRLRLGLATLLLLGAIGCASAQPQTAAPTGQRARGTPGTGGVAVSVQTVQQGAVASTVSYAGNVQSHYSVQVMPRATGRIEQLLVDVGSSVRTGDLLAVLDRSQLQANVLQSEGALRVAEAKLAQNVAQGRPEEIDAARSQLAAAEEKLGLMLAGGRGGDVAAAEANASAAQVKLVQVTEGTRTQIASAEATVATNRANLRAAREKLDQLLAGGAPADQDAAVAAVDTARASVDQAIAQRDLLVNPPQATVQSARADLDKAEANLISARATLEQLMTGGAPADRVAAETAVDSAYSTLLSAQRNLAVLRAGGTPSQRGSAVAQVQTAQSQLRAARVQYQQASSPGGGRALVALQQQASQQQQQLQNNQNQATAACSSGGSPSSDLGSITSSASASAQCSAALAQQSLAEISLELTQFAIAVGAQGADPANVANARATLDAAAAQVLASSTQLGDLDTPPPNSLQSAVTAVDQAQASLDTAAARLDALRNPPLATRVQAETAVTQAEAAQRAARDNYDQVVAGGAPAQQRQAEAAIEVARGNVRQAEAKLAGLRTPAPADVAAAQTAVESAAAQLVASEEQLALQVGPQARADLEAALASLQQAQNTVYNTRVPYREEEIRQQREAVRQARDNLALKAEPYQLQDVASARASVEQARGAYNLAVEQERDAYVYAPFYGVVSARQMSLGALASPSTAIYTVVSDRVEVWVNIEESDLNYVRPGITATMNVSPYRGETFNATVDVISSSGDPRNRTFQTKLVAPNPGGQLKDGMFAQVSFLGNARENVVLVPLTALINRGGINFAFVVVDGRARQRELRLGITDGLNAEVLSGLQAGDELIIAGLSSVTDGAAVTVVPLPAATPGRNGPEDTQRRRGPAS